MLRYTFLNEKVYAGQGGEKITSMLTYNNTESGKNAETSKSRNLFTFCLAFS